MSFMVDWKSLALSSFILFNYWKNDLVVNVLYCFYIIYLHISLRKIILKENHKRLKKTLILSKTSFWKQIHDFNFQTKPSAKADQLEVSEKPSTLFFTLFLLLSFVIL